MWTLTVNALSLSVQLPFSDLVLSLFLRFLTLTLAVLQHTPMFDWLSFWKRDTNYGTHSKVFLLTNLVSFKLSVHISARRQRSRRQRVPFRHVGPRQDPHLGLQLHRRRDHGLRSGESNIYSSIDSLTKLALARRRSEAFPTMARLIQGQQPGFWSFLSLNRHFSPYG